MMRILFGTGALLLMLNKVAVAEHYSQYPLPDAGTLGERCSAEGGDYSVGAFWNHQRCFALIYDVPNTWRAVWRPENTKADGIPAGSQPKDTPPNQLKNGSENCAYKGTSYGAGAKFEVHPTFLTTDHYTCAVVVDDRSNHWRTYLRRL